MKGQHAAREKTIIPYLRRHTYRLCINKLKSKAVPLHTKMVLEGRGSIAPTLSRPRK
jgi:hypothetical protein